MPSWEYLFVRAIRTPEGIQVETNGHRLEQTYETLGEFYTFCNQVGGQGWELVSERQVSNESVQLIFKRSKG
jgi:hypothetical protein